MPGVATGIGSMPGTDPMEAARIVVGELPDFPHLAELPARGPGADITRPDGRPARGHPRRGHAARLADRRATRPRPAPGQVDAGVGPGCHGGSPRLLRGTAQATGLRPLDAGRHARAAALAERRARRPGPGRGSRRLAGRRGRELTSRRWPSACRGRRWRCSSTSRRCPRCGRRGADAVRPSRSARSRRKRCASRLHEVLSAVNAGHQVVHCCARDVPFGIIACGRGGRDVDRPQPAPAG